jgi:hypothetical protein
MYVVEWIAWSAYLTPKWMREWAPEETEGMKHSAAERAGIPEERARMAAERYEEARPPAPVYACNDTYLEIRCGAQAGYRGLITFCSLIFVYGILKFLGFFLMVTNDVLKDGVHDYGLWLFWLGISEIIAVLIYFYAKYIIHFTRLETLTSRHLLIRFNRVTRQVHLHRPPYCGGIVTLPWEGILHDTPSPYPLMVYWENHEGEYGFPPTIAWIGKPTPSIREQQAQWEYIRRYMDEGGLQAVEKPKIVSQFPWPWQAFALQFEGVGRFLYAMGPLMWFACILISPAFLITGLSCWVSLLLCWKPRWPKIIREAGEPGKPVPKISSIDDYPPKVAEELKRKSNIWMTIPDVLLKNPKARRTRKKTVPKPESGEQTESGEISAAPESEPEKPKRPRRKRPSQTAAPETAPETEANGQKENSQNAEPPIPWPKGKRVKVKNPLWPN